MVYNGEYVAYDEDIEKNDQLLALLQDGTVVKVDDTEPSEVEFGVQVQKPSPFTVAGDVSYCMPGTDGAATQALSTCGSCGELFWQTVGGGGGSAWTESTCTIYPTTCGHTLCIRGIDGGTAPTQSLINLCFIGSTASVPALNIHYAGCGLNIDTCWGGWGSTICNASGCTLLVCNSASSIALLACSTTLNDIASVVRGVFQVCSCGNRATATFYNQSATDPSLVVAGQMHLADSSFSCRVVLQNSATQVAACYALTLPVDAGTSGQVLCTDGTGVLGWMTGGADVGLCISGTTISTSCVLNKLEMIQNTCPNETQLMTLCRAYGGSGSIPVLCANGGGGSAVKLCAQGQYGLYAINNGSNVAIIAENSSGTALCALGNIAGTTCMTIPLVRSDCFIATNSSAPVLFAGYDGADSDGCHTTVRGGSGLDCGSGCDFNGGNIYVRAGAKANSGLDGSVYVGDTDSGGVHLGGTNSSLYFDGAASSDVNLNGFDLDCVCNVCADGYQVTGVAGISTSFVTCGGTTVCVCNGLIVSNA
jgi:hypothetical protein